MIFTPLRALALVLAALDSCEALPSSLSLRGYPSKCTKEKLLLRKEWYAAKLNYQIMYTNILSTGES